MILRVVILFLLAKCAFADNAEREIIWARTNFPPGFILDGSAQGTGYGDRLNKYMVKHLPQFKHTSVIYPNWTRLLLEQQTNKQKVICSSAFFYRKPGDREDIKDKNLLSAPNFVFFLHDVIVKKSKRHLYPEEVSFRKLLNNKELKYGFSRIVGPIYNKVLGDYLGVKDLGELSVEARLKALHSKKNIIVRLSEDMVEGPLKMILYDRIDYTLEYEFMVNFVQDKIKSTGELVAIPVKEAKDGISVASYGCSPHLHGSEAINAINKVLIRDRNKTVYKENLSYLLPSSDERKKTYWDRYNDLLDMHN